MKILKFKSTTQSELIKNGCRVLRQGGVVVVPTDTAYGLAADPFNQSAIKKIYQIKGRPSHKGLPLVISQLKQLRQVARVSPGENKLISRYWPGPLTIIFQKKTKASRLLTGQQNTIAVRWPKHKLLQALLDKFGQPLTATSANLSGQPVCYSIPAAIKQFKHSRALPDLVIDAGQLKEEPVSTIIKVDAGKIKILRTGALKMAKLNVR